MKNAAETPSNHHALARLCSSLPGNFTQLSALSPDHDTDSDRAARQWRPGSTGALHSEIFACGNEAAGAGMALSLALDAMRAAARDGNGPAAAAPSDDQRAILWVQERAAAKRGGYPYRPGMPPDLQRRVIHVLAEKPKDALFALEEGVRCRDLAFVIGEIVGNPQVLDFTASRRLSLAAEHHGVPLWLVRIDARRDLSSARMRWDARSAPSPRPRWNRDAPGTPGWHASLFRSRIHPPAEWIMRDDGYRLDVEPPARQHTGAGQGSGQANPVDLVRAAGD
ncbi:hypothetical protein [Pseudopontixanthobacter vadosimaris]|uniref:hypothetical protein n=1 Tax=Pseudopontixanthobacter vadosimaris TaxID=2726450 RepID=UPI0014729CE9|nr:hypothetical protein [Pseudopontixanthobacter vadosimaris]